MTAVTRIGIFAVGRRGAALAGRLCARLGGDAFVPPRFLNVAGPTARPLPEGGVRRALPDAFASYQEIVLILPVGAAVRLVAPLLRNKQTDPAVVVVDEAGQHAVALLSAHVGGANHLARQVGAAIGARPVVTTTSEALDLPSLDVLGREWGWSLEVVGDLTRAMAALIDGDPIGVCQEAGEEGWWSGAPANLRRFGTLADLLEADVAARVVISDRLLPLDLDRTAEEAFPHRNPPLLGRGSDPADDDARNSPSAAVGKASGVLGPMLIYRPRTLVVGVGCVRGATATEIGELLGQSLAAHGLALASVREIATIDVKRDEAGIAELAAQLGVPVRYFAEAALGDIQAPSGPSDKVRQAVGTPAVCEPAALLAAGATTLVVEKKRSSRATVAVARAALVESTAGRLTIVGIGPGDPSLLTDRAREALVQADAIVGYDGYLDQVRPWLGPKAYHGSPIGDEAGRCRLAITLSRQGRRVALISSGDAGIYAMAGLVFELLGEAGAGAAANAVEVVPGITAAQAVAAILGAPLMADFMVVSLSDLMTPWDVIERRIEAAARGDLVIALYNPASRTRRRQIERAVEILLRERAPETPVGIGRNATRPGQEIRLTDLGRLLDQPIDMFTVVLVGNSATIRIGDRLVTRRGYLAGESFGARRSPSAGS